MLKGSSLSLRLGALTDADYKLKEAGVEKDVELGAVLWTEFTAPQVK